MQIINSSSESDAHKSHKHERLPTGEPSKMQRTSKVTFAAPLISEMHHIKVYDLDSAMASAYARSAALFAPVEEDEDETDEEYIEEKVLFVEDGAIICPASGSVSFAFPVVTDVWTVPRYTEEEKDDLFYNSLDIAAFSISEVLAGRRFFGQRRELKSSRRIHLGSVCDDNTLLASKGLTNINVGIEHCHPFVMII